MDSMQSRPRNAVEALRALLQRWVDTAFPSETRSDDAAALLTFLWRELISAIRGPSAPEVDEGVHESILLEAGGHPGAPPLRTLDRQVSARFPAAAPTWMSLADEYLPLYVQFGLDPDEVPPPTTSHKVGR